MQGQVQQTRVDPHVLWNFLALRASARKPTSCTSVSSHCPVVAMGRKAADKKTRGGGSKPAPKDDKKKSNKGSFVPKYAYFGKERLAAYPNEDGVCVYVGKGQDEKAFFTLENICACRSSKNEELCHRIGMGLALDAASIHNGTKVLHKHFGEAIPDDLQQQFHKTGLPKILEALASDAGQRFVQSIEVLDVGKTGQPREKAIKKALKGFVEYLQEDDGTLRRNLARLASDAAALYLFAMTLLKDMALVSNPKEWAAKVEGKQSDEVKAWLRKPKDDAKLLAALVHELLAKVEKKASDTSSMAKDSSEAADTGSGSGDGSEASKAASEESSSPAPAVVRKSSSKSSRSSSPQPPKKKKAKTSDKKDAKKDAKKEKNEKKDKTEEKRKKDEKDDAKDKKDKKTEKPDRNEKDKKAKKEKELKAEKDRKRKEEQRAAEAATAAAEAEEEARTAAFTAWSASSVQEAAEQLEEARASIGLLSGRFKKETMVNLTSLVPTAVLTQFPEVCVATAELAEVGGEWVSNKEAKPAIVMLTEVANTVAAFWAEHAEAPAASGKPSERAEVAEENESEEAKEEEKEPFE